MHCPVRRFSRIRLSFLWLAVLVSPSLLGAPQKLVSLAPHTTELVFALGHGDNLLAVSDFSDYPQKAQSLPRVASHNGVDFEAVMRLQPDLILAWPGGNKPQDLARLRALGFTLFTSSPQAPQDIATDILRLGQALGAEKTAEPLAAQYMLALEDLVNRYQTPTPTWVFYYLWQQPIMTVGKGAWANHLLKICGARNVLEDLPVQYPTVSLEQVLSAKPAILIGALHDSEENQTLFWQQRLPQLKAPVKIVNPDLLHRFTPRLIEGVESLCQQLH